MDLLKKPYKFEEPIKKKGKSKTYKYNYSTTMMDLMTEANNSTNPSLKKKSAAACKTYKYNKKNTFHSEI